MKGKRLWNNNWEKNISAARRYFEENGNLACKSNYVTPEGIKLGNWLSNIRNAESGDSCLILTDERKAQLDAIGMIWDMYEYFWEENFLEAQRYYLEHQNLNVPCKYVTESGFHLGVWIHKLRKKYASNELSTERIKRLESIGMIWTNRFDTKWLVFYEEAKAFYEEYGHLQVPSDYLTKEKFKLGRWLLRQRNKYQKGIIDSKKVSMLNEIGMTWEIAVYAKKDKS